jgi:Fur family transcriptional regulator, ferric uptake regulator
MKIKNLDQIELKTNIKEKPVWQIELKGEYIVVYVPQDEIDSFKEKAKMIKGWRLSRGDKAWYFPLEKALEVLNLFK